MNLTLEVPKEIESVLVDNATRAGLSVNDFALSVLAGENVIVPKITNGAELVAYWEVHGLIGSRPDIKDSAKHARAIRRKAESRIQSRKK